MEDQMPIKGTDHSPAILSQRKKFQKLESANTS